MKVFAGVKNALLIETWVACVVLAGLRIAGYI